MDFHLCFDRFYLARPRPLLVALEWAAQYRGQNNWIIWLLPIGGLLID
jgi:hypothetical protein